MYWAMFVLWVCPIFWFAAVAIAVEALSTGIVGSNPAGAIQLPCRVFVACNFALGWLVVQVLCTVFVQVPSMALPCDVLAVLVLAVQVRLMCWVH